MYSSDCARTVVCGKASARQKELTDLYRNIQQSIISDLKPGWKVGQVTSSFTESFTAKGFGAQWIPRPVHKVGLDFEEWPHPSHYFSHTQLNVAENWTLAIGNSILPIKSIGGIKLEDTVLITGEGGRILTKSDSPC
jgi:Xaa-Pro aminopeptidase